MDKVGVVGVETRIVMGIKSIIFRGNEELSNMLTNYLRILNPLSHNGRVT